MKLFLAVLLAGIVFTPRTFAQRIIIDGYVVNSETGKHLKDVNIFDKISGVGTISDNSGYFRLMLNAGEVKLLFHKDSFTEYYSEFIAQNDTVLTVGLLLEKDLKKDSLKISENKELSSTTGIKKFFKK